MDLRNGERERERGGERWKKKGAGKKVSRGGTRR